MCKSFVFAHVDCFQSHWPRYWIFFSRWFQWYKRGDIANLSRFLQSWSKFVFNYNFWQIWMHMVGSNLMTLSIPSLINSLLQMCDLPIEFLICSHDSSAGKNVRRKYDRVFFFIKSGRFVGLNETQWHEITNEIQYLFECIFFTQTCKREFRVLCEFVFVWFIESIKLKRNNIRIVQGMTFYSIKN